MAFTALQPATPGVTMSLPDKLRQIKLLLLDFDGVLTDGYVFVNQDGGETVRCSRRDSLGILMLKKAGIEVGIVSKETSSVVAARCKKMGVPYWQGIKDGEGKREIVERIADEKSVTLSQVAFIGDDVNDQLAMQLVGIAIAVADAHPQVQKIAHYVTKAPGGHHAVREICELILKAKSIEPTY